MPPLVRRVLEAVAAAMGLDQGTEHLYLGFEDGKLRRWSRRDEGNAANELAPLVDGLLPTLDCATACLVLEHLRSRFDGLRPRLSELLVRLAQLVEPLTIAASLGGGVRDGPARAEKLKKRAALALGERPPRPAFGGKRGGYAAAFRRSSARVSVTSWSTSPRSPVAGLPR
jgi:hypothetical protein